MGTFEDEDVVVAVGKFGPYVRHAGKFVSLPKEIAPLELTLDQAQELILAKRTSEASRVLMSWPEEPELQVLNGRFGAYISYKKQNYKIPRKINATTLTLEQCREIVADEANASKGGTRKRAKK